MATKEQIEHAWENAKPIRGQNPDVWRRDVEGNKIRRGSYGTQGEYGWEVDHKNPTSKGGTDSLRNVQALHWKANREKGDKRG
ncbi:MAG TPA: HNH endonuclease signature motif containing protein [Bryobacteraceae bacterium]|nr:HNH endonuclease signature motif containing protein [Bryobacteraceae bacterium]